MSAPSLSELHARRLEHWRQTPATHIPDAAAAGARNQARLEAIDREERLRIAELRRKSALRVALKLSRLMVVQQPKLVLFLKGQAPGRQSSPVALQATWDPMSSAIDVSYLADNVLLLRYFETHGAVRQALSVLKKRTGVHERTIRELRITSDGLEIGEPLRQFRGVLTGVPQEDPSPPAGGSP